MRDLEGQRVLVTGGAGFIGSHVVRECVRRGASVIVIDNLVTGKVKNLYCVDSYNIWVPVTDVNAVFTYVKSADYVIHLAAISSGLESIEEPVTCNDVNVHGTVILLNLIREESVKKFVFASSSDIYGSGTPKVATDESTRMYPMSPYAVSKLAGEKYCKIYEECYGLKTAVLRLFSVYGENQRGLIGQYGSVIPNFVSNLLNCQPVTIYGNGKQTRDFVYVKDVAKAFADVLLLDQEEHVICNIGSGESVSIIELYNILCDLLHVSTEILYESPRKGSPFHSLADIGNAKKLLGFSPVSAKVGLSRCLKWYRKELSRVRVRF